MLRKGLVFSVFLFSILCKSAMADGQKQEPATYKHILGNHVFLPSLVIPPAFSDSNVALGLTFGYGTGSAMTSNGLTEVKLGTFRPAFNIQVAILKRLAVSFGMTASQITGLNGNSVLYYGASISYNYAFGAIYELIRSESTVFSLSLNVLKPRTLVASPYVAAQEGIALFVQESDPEFVQSTISTQWKPMIRAAHALGAVFGLQGALGLNLNSYSVGGDVPSSSKLLIAAGVDADLDPVWSVPLGISFGYQRNQVLSLGALNSDNFAIGLFETFRKSFNTGIQVGKSYVGDKNASSASLVAKIYFD